MTKTRKVVVAVALIVALLALLIWATSPPESEFRFGSPASGQVEERVSHTKVTRWRLKVTRRAQQLRSDPRGGCPRRFVATAHTWGGSQWFHEIISFDSRIEWCGLSGGRMRNPHVYITPDNARFLWGYDGVVGSSQGHTSGAHCGPFPQPECMFFERHVQYSRDFEGVGQFTTPKIRWVVTASGGCQIRKPSGQWEGCMR